MNAPLILAVPSKGRLQQNAEAFFARAGLELVKPRGARDYRGTVVGHRRHRDRLSLRRRNHRATQPGRGASRRHRRGSAARDDPAIGRAHRLITGLGFGFANVVVAVPQAWIDVRNMADLDDVATAFRLSNERKMRLATKYANLTRGFFAEHGVVDYRIVESSGATEGAPAAGTAELIVDITTTGSTLAANGLKVIEDGIILRSQANLVAARAAAWGEAQRETARLLLDRIAAQKRAVAFREVRTRFAGMDEKLLAVAREKFGVASPFGGPTSSGMLTLHCPPEYVHDLASFLREHGAAAVSVAAIDYVYTSDNPLYAKLAAELDKRALAVSRSSLPTTHRSCYRGKTADPRRMGERRDTVMGKDRLAAFSDGVIAIIITIMVLELKVPHGADWAALKGLGPNFVSYVLSFIYLAIYWNNHHHLIHTVARVDGVILWANSHLLFWLSLIPAATAWMGENFLAPLPTAVYGAILLMPAIAYYLLQTGDRAEARYAVRAGARARQRHQRQDIAVRFTPRESCWRLSSHGSRSPSMRLVAIMWLVPDRRIERALREG